MQTMIFNAKLSNNWLLASILSFGVFSILNTELGVIGLIPILQTHFNVSVASASWAVSIFALMITICAPVVPLLCAGFNQKKLMLLCLVVFSLASFLSIFANAFWQYLFLISACMLIIFSLLSIALRLRIGTKLS